MWLQKLETMNWGYKITIVIATFIVAMLSMVFIASKQTNDMIDSNYYAKELAYQQIIDAVNNTKPYLADLSIEQNKEVVTLKLPTEITNLVEANAKIELIKVDDKSKDTTIPLMLNNSKQIISKSNLHAGVYLIRISWKNSGVAYYHKQNINVKK
jgi:hypothetical protein